MSTEADTQAHDTNRRLNRRLGEMEHDLYSFVSHAQREANQAILRASEAQERVERFSKLLHRADSRTIADEIAMGRLILALVAVSLTAIILGCILIFIWVKS